MLDSNAIIAMFTVLIFLTGVAYTIFAGLQWSEMARTNGNLAKQLADARDMQAAQLSVEPPETAVIEGGSNRREFRPH